MSAVIVKLLATLAILCQLGALEPSSVSSADTFPQGKADLSTAAGGPPPLCEEEADWEPEASA